MSRPVQISFIIVFLLIILTFTRCWGQILPYLPFSFNQAGYPFSSQASNPLFFAPFPQAFTNPAAYYERLVFDLLTQNYNPFNIGGINNIAPSAGTYGTENGIVATATDSSLSPFISLTNLNLLRAATSIFSQIPGPVSLIQNPLTINPPALGGLFEQNFIPPAAINSLGQVYSIRAPEGLYAAAAAIPPYRINDTGITLAEKYEGTWESTIYIGAGAEIKLKELSQFETDFFADIKFKEHPIAASEGSVTGVVEGNVVSFTVYFDNPCIGTFSGTGNSAYISGTYIISCFDGSYLDEGIFELEAE